MQLPLQMEKYFQRCLAETKIIQVFQAIKVFQVIQVVHVIHFIQVLQVKSNLQHSKLAGSY